MRLLAMVLLCLPLHVLAHGDAHERIHQIDAQLERKPGNADLHLRRGQIYLEERHAAEARADFERALVLDPGLHAARYFLSDALLLSGQPAPAETQVLQFIQAQAPEQKGALSRGYWLLGEIRFALRRPVEAVAAYEQAFSHTAEPTPSHYRSYIDACLAAGGQHLDEARLVLDQAMAKGGAVDALLEMAVEVEMKAGHTESALRRMESWIAQGKSLPFLHYRRAEILAGAERLPEARQALAVAGAALADIPERRRKSKAYAELARQISALGERVGGQVKAAG